MPAQRHFVILGLLCLILLNFPGSALAVDNEAQNLYERGRFEFSDEEYQAALGFFDQALVRDPGNIQYQIARGQALFKLKRYDEAEAQFNQVIASGPEGAGAGNVELGALYAAKKDYARAAEHYSRAIEVSPASAHLYLARGSMYLELKDYARAEADFEKAAAVDPKLALSSRYQMAVSKYRREDLSGALKLLDQTLTMNPDEAQAARIKRFRQIVQRENKAFKPWSVNAGVFYQYDDNVIQRPNDQVGQAATDKADGSVGGFFNANYYFFNRRSGNAGVSYTFQTQRYQNLTENDLSAHTLGLFHTGRIDPWYYRLRFNYGYYETAGEHVLNLYQLAPVLGRFFGKTGRLELLGGLERKDWVDGRDDADRYVLGGTWFQTLAPARRPESTSVVFRGGLHWEQEVTRGDNDLAYSIREIKTGVTFPLFLEFFGDLGLNYARVFYDRDENLFNGEKREDDRIMVLVRAGRRITDTLRFDFQFVHTKNDSNYKQGGSAPYDFRRNVYTLMLTGSF